MITAQNHRITLHFVEKRRSPRLPCHLPVDAVCQQKYGFNHITDISLNGVGIFCGRPAPENFKGKHVKLRFYLPGQEKFVERVARVVFADDQNVGLHFLPSEKEEQELYRQYYLSVNRITALEEIQWAPQTGADSTEEAPTLVERPAAEPRMPSDKRASARKPLKQEFRIELTSKNLPIKVTGRVTDESRHGVSFELLHPPGVPLSFRVGHKFSDGVITGNGKTVRTGPARVCHITPSRTQKGVIKVGLSIPSAKSGSASAAAASAFTVVKVNPAKIQPEPTNGAVVKDQPGLSFPIPVHYKNAAGEEIAGLLNTTFGSKTESKIPVVVIVPGYGQRKETAALLTQILIQTFLHQKKDLAVLRFDFTRTLGESYHDLPEEEIAGAEYLTFTFSQALQDLQSTLEYVRKNSHFTPSQIALVSTGFATPLVLRALLEEEKMKIAGWINFFGATDPQEWMKKSAPGIDPAAQVAQGRRFGVISFPGSLIHADRLCADLLQLKMAFLDDARREIAQLAAPITWICGATDATVPLKKVRELMEVSAPASRKLIELPLGHLHYNHVKATPAFYLVAEELFAALHHGGKKVRACVPDPDLLKKITAREWSRLK